ncbi:unnamed protein product [Periconia digitata]|uniref:Uncharacterized protein n=1 Tax=Periconia digitata TaxID=1303443 RepID=A0A9W4U2E0_9PLEO|nr:unnamed protein product [Periconia digitata]
MIVSKARRASMLSVFSIHLRIEDVLAEWRDGIFDIAPCFSLMKMG